MADLGGGFFQPASGTNYISNVKDTQPIYGGGTGYAVTNPGSGGSSALTQNGNFIGTTGSVDGANTHSSGGDGPVAHSTPGGGVSIGYNGPNEDPYAQVKADISSAWDNYLGGLGGVSDYLGQQQDAQKGIADTQLTQGQNTINNQKASSLRDIANTTRNAFQAGNNYLGSLGAGDSSAANQYSFAINKQAGKQTGDLNNFVNGQLQQLQGTHDTQINSIANWFAQQQAALKQQVAQGQLSKGQDLANLSKGILDQAIQATNQIKQNTQNQYNGLLSWAAQNSQNMGQLQQNIAAIPQAMGAISLQGGAAANNAPRFAPTGAQTTKTDIFGNPIQ